jgi:hypothetical protein
MAVVSGDSALIKGTYLSGGEVPSFKRQFSCAVWPGSDLPDGGLYGITGLNRRSELDAIINQRIWVIVPDRGHDGSSDKTKRAQPMEDDTSEPCCLANPGIYGNVSLAHAKRDGNVRLPIWRGL